MEKYTIGFIALRYLTNAMTSEEVLEELGLEHKEEEVVSLLGDYQKKWDKYINDGEEEYEGDDGDIILSELSDDISELY